MIYVELKKSIGMKDDDKSLFLRFDYNPEIVSKIKQIRPREWHPMSKSWEIPQSSIGELVEIFGKESLIIHEDVNLNYTKPLEYVVCTTNEKWNYFNPLLETMQKDVAEFTIEILKSVPSYFYEVPASSSGKHHPSYALGDGGLLRHTMAAGLIALDLFRNDTVCGEFTHRAKSLLLSAIILHDTFKLGVVKDKYAVDHPVLAASFIKNFNQTILPVEDVKIIADCISTHMGQWNTDFQKIEVMEKPRTKEQSFVHMCDYLASRKSIEINFDAVEC